MITALELTEYIRIALPDAQVDALDTTGTSDHWAVSVASDAFAGVAPLERHRMVYRALAQPLANGQLHAIEIKTGTKK